MRWSKDASAGRDYHRAMEQRDSGPPSLFAGLTEDERAALIARADIREFGPHTVLHRQGEPAQSLCLMKTGRVALTCTSTKGRHILLRFIGPGDAFGIPSLLTHSDDIASAIALTPTSVYRWNSAALQSVPVYPRLVENALRMTLRYLRDYGERHVGLLARTAEQRLARTLMRLVDTTGHASSLGIEVEVSNDDLAALSDVGMFTTSRQLGKWEREGHLTKRRRRILIHDANALRRRM